MKSGYSKKIIDENIALLIHEGHLPERAAALAFTEARRAYRAKFAGKPLPNFGELAYMKNPLKSGYSKKTVSDNIARMMREGKTRAQAVAIAMNSGRVAFFKRHPDGFIPHHLTPKTGAAAKAYRKNPVPTVNKGAQAATAELKQAMALYQKFSGHKPKIVGKTKVRPMPAVGIVIGELDGIAYETVRDNVKEKYFHKFDKAARPLLCSSFDGKQLYVIEGSYDFTEDGIVDRK